MNTATTFREPVIFSVPETEVEVLTDELEDIGIYEGDILKWGAVYEIPEVEDLSECDDILFSSLYNVSSEFIEELESGDCVFNVKKVEVYPYKIGTIVSVEPVEEGFHSGHIHRKITQRFLNINHDGDIFFSYALSSINPVISAEEDMDIVVNEEKITPVWV